MPQPEGRDDRIEELVLRCVEADDVGAELAAVGAEVSAATHARVRRVVERMQATWFRTVGPDHDASARLRGLAPGDRLGPFELHECLGRGGMGAVWRATDTRLGRDLALKQVHPHLVASAAMRARFEREARAASRLDHAGLCTVFESGDVDGVPFLAMQLVQGESLRARVDLAAAGAAPLLPAMTSPAVPGEPLLPGGRDLDRLLEFAVALCEAIEHAHQSGLVHRDIKPGNVMVTDRGGPMVLDFGLVRDDRVDQALTMSGELLGTPQYMAPEQITGSGGVDRLTDVYALGATLYELLALRTPFAGETFHALQREIVQAPVVPLREHNRAIPRDLGVVVAKAMDRTPARRYASAQALADDLRRVRERRPVLARPAPAWLRGWRWVQRNPVVATFLLLTSLGLLITTRLLLEAQRARDASERNLEAFHLMGSVRRLARAETTAAQLFPQVPALVPALDAWLAYHVPLLQDDLARVRAGLATLDEQLAAEVPGAAFDRESMLLLHETLRGHLPELEAFLAADGRAAEVAARRAWAAGVAAQSLERRHEQWAEACAAIAASDGTRAHEEYRGLDLGPQLGLVPIGCDPESKLWEFLDLHSGDGVIPARDPATGALAIAASTGVVFVLLPGGLCTMGAQAADPDAPNHDPRATPQEGPPQRIELAPFFLSKYELTQAQWSRLNRGDRPSRYVPGVEDGVTDLNPVEQVSALDAQAVTRREGWVLPTEAQWEYAARAGRSLRFPWGDEPVDAHRHANLADATFQARFGSKDLGAAGADGFATHAPVGSFPPNGFGLHDMIGNVQELTADGWRDDYSSAVSVGTGKRLHVSPAFTPYRGSAFRHPAYDARVSRRRGSAPDDAQQFTGLRPARAIDALANARLPEISNNEESR
ncbi:MAG: bifunctional serine/threonine-protein kinase/formylglycine-generating enzyme family protein [Planctomycetota bacterium]